MKKIYNFQITQIAERSNIIEIADEDIQALKNWKENPYTGTSDQDLVQYIANLKYEFPSPETAPDFAQQLYDQLFGEVERTELWNSLEKSGDSKLVLEDNDGNSLAEADSGM